MVFCTIGVDCRASQTVAAAVESFMKPLLCVSVNPGARSRLVQRSPLDRRDLLRRSFESRFVKLVAAFF
jgi:hypothetical protein